MFRKATSARKFEGKAKFRSMKFSDTFREQIQAVLADKISPLDGPQTETENQQKIAEHFKPVGFSVLCEQGALGKTTQLSGGNLCDIICDYTDIKSLHLLAFRASF